MKVEIYALTEPDSGEVRYIGKANDAQKRFKSHMCEMRRKTPVYCWIGALRKKGQIPGLSILEVCNSENWCDVERAAIAAARREGARLLNVAEGGDEPYCSKEVRAENGRKNAKARVSDPWKAYIWKLKNDVACLLKQGYGTNEDRALMRNAARLRPDLFGCFADVKDLTEGSEAYRKAYPSKFMSDELNLKYMEARRARQKATG